MDPTTAQRDAARSMPGGMIGVVDEAQAVMRDGRIMVPSSAIRGFFGIDDDGEIIAFTPNPDYNPATKMGA